MFWFVKAQNELARGNLARHDRSRRSCASRGFRLHCPLGPRTRPPSTRRTAPVTYAASSDARKATTVEEGTTIAQEGMMTAQEGMTTGAETMTEVGIEIPVVATNHDINS